MNTDEKELIRRSKEGDVYAFEELIAAHQKKVINIAYIRMGNIDDAADIAQEVFVKVYKSISKFNEEATFSTWLYKITYNTCLDELRKRKRRHEDEMTSIDKETEEGSSQIQIADHRTDPETVFYKNEQQRVIASAIESLSEEHRSIITLREIDGLSYEDIAEVLECSLGTVKSRISRARLALKNILSDKLELFT